MTGVLSVVHYYPPHIGGMEMVAQKQAEGLAQAGFSSRVVTSACEGGPPGHRQEGDVHVIRCAANNTLDRRFGLPFPLLGAGLWRTLWHEVRWADLVHLHDVFYMPSWVAFLCALRWRKPVVLTQHVAMVEHPSAAVMTIQRLVYATFGRAIFGYARQIIVYNHNVREFLKAQGVPERKIKELRNGIDTSLFRQANPEEKARLRKKYGLPQEKVLVLFVGRLVAKKGFDKVFAARSSKYSLLFVGPGKPPEGARAQAEDALFLGPRTQEEVAELYQASDIFVFPAVGEILTLVMQEAMASGLPVVTTDDPAYQEYDFDKRLLRLIPAQPEALRAALEALADDPELRSEMAEYSRKVAAERFDWNSNFSRLLQIYAPILEGK